MRTHCLKCWPEPFRAIADGAKTHEFRRNDRDFGVGDMLILDEWNPASKRYTGYSLYVVVTYIGHGFGIPDGFVCMSIRVKSYGCRFDNIEDEEGGER